VDIHAPVGIRVRRICSTEGLGSLRQEEQSRRGVSWINSRGERGGSVEIRKRRGWVARRTLIATFWLQKFRRDHFVQIFLNKMVKRCLKLLFRIQGLDLWLRELAKMAASSAGFIEWELRVCWLWPQVTGGGSVLVVRVAEEIDHER
jgi:hypothetical protein